MINTAIYCCCSTCYKLTACLDSGDVSYTETDLSEYVGGVVLIDGDCYEVAEAETCTDPAAVTVDDSYDDCDGPCPCPSAIQATLADIVADYCHVISGTQSRYVEWDADANGTYAVPFHSVLNPGSGAPFFAPRIIRYRATLTGVGYDVVTHNGTTCADETSRDSYGSFVLTIDVNCTDLEVITGILTNGTRTIYDADSVQGLGVAIDNDITASNNQPYGGTLTVEDAG